MAVIFSQDQDLSEVAKELRVIAREQDRWLKVAYAFPASITTRNRRGIEATDWIRIDKATYDKEVPALREALLLILLGKKRRGLKIASIMQTVHAFE